MKPITITDVRAVPGDSGFLLDNGTTSVLFDSGFAFTGNRITENIRRVLGDRPLDYILLTHSHYDHVLATPYIFRAYPRAKVVAASHAAEVFKRPSAKVVMRRLNENAAQIQQMTNAEDLIDQLNADIEVEDGDVISCGDLRFTVIALPGHTRDSVGYYLHDHKLLVSTETLGVYFGGGVHLPSFLVGYELTLDSFRRARQLDVEQALLPHYGVVDRATMQSFLDQSEAVTKETAGTILKLLQAGCSCEEVLQHLTELHYSRTVVPTYPSAAFRLNTGIMIGQIQKELL